MLILRRPVFFVVHLGWIDVSPVSCYRLVSCYNSVPAITLFHAIALFLAIVLSLAIAWRMHGIRHGILDVDSVGLDS
jgi:hypothetical protein